MENLESIYADLDKLILKHSNELGNWSKNYLNLHKKRYFHDIETLKKHYTDGEILEIGAAPYQLTYLLKQLNFPITGIDIAPERHQNFLNDVSLNIKKCNIENDRLPFKNNYFKFILFNEVFEHLRINPIKTLREINRVLHPNGTLMLSTPNLYSIYNIFKMLRGKGFDNPYNEFLKLETIGHMGHVREYSISQMVEFLEKTGFKGVEVYRVSHREKKGIKRIIPFILWLLPFFHKYQVHLAKKINPKN